MCLVSSTDLFNRISSVSYELLILSSSAGNLDKPFSDQWNFPYSYIKQSQNDPIVYSKTCVKRPVSKRSKISFQDQLSLNTRQKYCRMGSILQYFRPSLSYHLSFRSLFCLFLSSSLTPVLLYMYIEGSQVIISPKNIVFLSLNIYFSWQTVQILMKCCILRHFIWVFIVCQSLFDLILYIPVNNLSVTSG